MMALKALSSAENSTSQMAMMPTRRLNSSINAMRRKASDTELLRVASVGGLSWHAPGRCANALRTTAAPG